MAQLAHLASREWKKQAERVSTPERRPDNGVKACEAVVEEET